MAAPAAAPAAPPEDPLLALRKKARERAHRAYLQHKGSRGREFVRGKGTLAIVYEDVCMGCTHCFYNCAFNAIDMREVRLQELDVLYNTRKAVIIDDNCVGCEKCAIICPVDAITMVTKPGFKWVGNKTVPETPTPPP